MPVSPNAKRLKFKAILSGSTCIHPAPVYDPVSAVLAEEIGFELGMAAGSAIAMSVLAAADIMVLTLTELADQVRRIGRASSLPLLVDADHGYGNAHNVIRAVEELEAAGAAGMTLEDTTLPPSYGHGHPPLQSIEEVSDKIRAAISARIDPDFVIVGRTSLNLTSLDDALARAVAYEAAGADAIFMHAVRDLDQIAAFRAALRIPLLAGSGLPAALFDTPRLAQSGVRVALYGHQVLEAALVATQQALEQLRSGRPLSEFPRPDGALSARARRSERFKQQARLFMGKTERM